MFRTFKASQLQLELNELKHKHRLDLEAQTAQFNREKAEWEKDKKRLEEDLKKDHEIKLREVLSLTKLESQQKIKQLEIDSERRINEVKAASENKMNDEIRRLNQEHYDKLSTAMAKLHEEGNATTKFQQELALKLIGSMPTAKSETKVLTGSLDVSGV